MNKKVVLPPAVRGWLIYLTLLAMVLLLAWLYGGQRLYTALYILLLLPVASLLTMLVMLPRLRVSQALSHTQLVKNEPGTYTLNVSNATPLLFAQAECRFVQSHFTIVAEDAPGCLDVPPFGRTLHTVPFYVKYRGEYDLGLKHIKLRDLTGLFAFSYRLKQPCKLTVLPQVADLTHFPLAANLLSQSHSSFDLREEDYATVSDVRAYIPSDSMKRIHWKLTAKKQEWLVKIFESHSLNKITILLDTTKPDCDPEAALATEDALLGLSLGLTHYALLRAMPVVCVMGSGFKQESRSQSEFESIYTLSAGIVFDTNPENGAFALVGQCLDEALHYVNAVVVTHRPDMALYERVVSANHMGHSIAVAYVAAPEPDPQAEDAFNKMAESHVACFKTELADL